MPKKTSALGVLLSVYIGLSPVYWWPFIPAEVFYYFKFTLVALAVITVISVSAQRSSLSIPHGYSGIIGFLIIFFAAVPGLIQGERMGSLIFIKDISLGFTMMWAIYLYVQVNENIWYILYFSAIIVALHCVLVTSSAAIGIPNWQAPADIRASELTADLMVSGFSTLRTGWSQGVALFLPIFLVAFWRSPVKRFLERLCIFVLSSAIVLSQFIVAGRAGILASMIQIFVIGTLMRRFFTSAGMLAIIIAVVSFNPQIVQEHLRFGRLDDGRPHGLDRFSAGRVSSGIESLQWAMESPLFGHGIKTGRWDGPEIHNLWLRLWVDAGIFLPAAFAVLVAVFLGKAAVLYRRSEEERDGQYEVAIASIAIFIGGVTISFFSPATLLGAFQNSAVWWVCAGAVCGYFDLSRQRPRKTAPAGKSMAAPADNGEVNLRTRPKSLRKTGTFPKSGRSAELE